MLYSRVGSPTGESMIVSDYMELQARDPAKRFLQTFCPACKEPTHTRLSEDKPSSNHFSHYPKKPDTPICSERELGSDTSVQYFRSVPREPEHASAIREQLVQPKFERAIYDCVSMVLKQQGIQRINVGEFRGLVKSASSLGLWEHKNMEIGTVPFALLYVGDFKSGPNTVRFRYKRSSPNEPAVLRPIRVTPEGKIKKGRPYPVTVEEARRLIGLRRSGTAKLRSELTNRTAPNVRHQVP